MTPSRTAVRLRALRAQGAAASLVALGRDLGLFVRLAGLPPSTRNELAQAARVDPDWLGDWLDGLVVAGLIDHDGVRRTYAIDAALAAEDALEHRLCAAGRALYPDVQQEALLVDVGADALVTIQHACARLAAGARLVVAVIDAARRVSDNLDHPHGAALYARSLARRAHGRGGLIDEPTLVNAFEAAGLRGIDARRLGDILVVAGKLSSPR